VINNVAGKRVPKRDIERFFLLSQLSERYSAAAETALNRDFRTLNDYKSARDGLSTLTASADKNARQFHRGLDVRPDRVQGLASKNVMLLLMYIVMRQKDALDWGSGPRKYLDDISPSDLHLHHIFPFNFMVENRIAQEAFTKDGRAIVEYRRAVNDIANLTFLSRESNIAIGDDPPSEYLALETSRAIRKAHFIPEDSALWRPERFEDFLNARRALMAKAITRLLKR
jgi:hypothetical protein